MLSTPTQTVFNTLTDFLASEPSPDAILAYQLPDDLQARARDLLERNGEGLLPFDEELEMHDFMRADDIMALLKAKTRLKLAQQHS